MASMTQGDASDRIDWLDLRSGRLGMAALARAGSLEPQDDVDALVLLVNVPGFDGGETRVLRYPIVDMGVPADPVAFGELLDEIVGEVAAGRSVLVACRAGFGRTGMTVACTLVRAGLAAEDAIALVRAARPGTIETDEQLAFVQGWRQG